MVLKLGISIYSVLGQDANMLLEFAVDNGFESIELWDSSFSEYSSTQIDDIVKTGLYISFHAPLLNLGDGESSETNIRRLEMTIQKADKCNADVIVLHTGTISPGADLDLALDAAQKAVEQVLSSIEEHGILLCIENVGYLGNDLISNFTKLMDFVERFPKNQVDVAFDVSHADISQDVYSGLESLRNRIRHVHLSDGDKQNHIHHLPLGRGMIDFSVLEKESFDCAGILEITPDENWKRNILDSRRFLQERNLVK